ncbi:MAG: HAMP domain-containing sensor histidine kinase [Bacteroidales bacterium]|nr:HAMP domain-containing sensor histidine kinase [Bacteroidales bacterium]
MEIRTKLGLQFTVIVAVIQMMLSMAILISFARSRVDDLYDRFELKAKSVGQVLMEDEGITAEKIKKIDQNNPLSLPNEKVVIYNHLDKIIFSNDENHDINITPEMIASVRVNNRARSRVGQHELLGRLFISGKDQMVVFVAAVDVYGIQKLAILRFILLIVFVVGLVIVYVAGRMFAGRAVQPILKVMEQVDRIEITNLHARLDEGPSKDEIARLSATFNKLLERLETSFKMQKSFIANASHELNTPLTVITGQLEVVLMKDRSNEEYQETISNVLNEIRNLNQLSKKLLLLAQASADLTSTNFALVRIDDLLWQVRSEMVSRFPEFSVVVDLDENLDDEDQLTVLGNELLLKTAITNIIENGCKYSGNHQVTVGLSKDEEGLVVHFVDKGIGIPEDELPMIFQPFYRSQAAKISGGHGIGLSLADKVITLHRGTLSVNSTVGKGSDFMICLPFAKSIQHAENV